jgi:hypothetical protein
MQGFPPGPPTPEVPNDGAFERATGDPPHGVANLLFRGRVLRGASFRIWRPGFRFHAGAVLVACHPRAIYREAVMVLPKRVLVPEHRETMPAGPAIDDRTPPSFHAPLADTRRRPRPLSGRVSP